jgi:hypothetical protein
VVSLIYEYTQTFDGIPAEVFPIDSFEKFLDDHSVRFADPREKRIHTRDGSNMSLSLLDNATTAKIATEKAATVGRWKGEYLQLIGGMGGSVYLTPDTESKGRCVIPSVVSLSARVMGMSCFTDAGGREFILATVRYDYSGELLVKFFDAQTGQPSAEPCRLNLTDSLDQLVGARYYHLLSVGLEVFPQQLVVHDFSGACDASGPPVIIRVDISTLLRGNLVQCLVIDLVVMNDYETVMVVRSWVNHRCEYFWLVLDWNFKFVRQVKLGVEPCGVIPYGHSAALVLHSKGCSVYC